MRPPGRARRSLAIVRPPVLDAVIAAGLLGWALIEVLLVGVPGQRSVAVVSAGFMTVPLAWRSRWPVLTGVVVGASFFAQSHLGVDANGEPSTIACVFLGAYAVGSIGAVRRAVLGVLPMLLLATGAVTSAGNAAFALLVVGGGWLVGRVLHARQEEARRSEQLAIERGVQARTAVLEERARIARELHDIVAHSVSVMVVQAGAAGEVLDGDPERARNSLELIQDSGHQALQELRRLLGVLRSGDTPDTLLPTPGLARLPELLDEFRAAGLVIEVYADQVEGGLDAGLDLTAYRVVQEALTNALKYGGNEPVVLQIRHRDGELFLSVVGGRLGSARSDARSGTGHGLIGMRERVAACGGRAETGWEAGIGFVVRAWLPAPAVTR